MIQPIRNCKCLSRLFALLLLTAIVTAAGGAAAAEKYELSEAPSPAPVYRVRVKVSVQGDLITPTEPGKAQKLPLEVDGDFDYLERRLSSAGRDAQSLRSIRSYQTAIAKLSVNQNASESQLRQTERLIVAHGRRTGPEFYSPQASMTAAELELLHVPGDSLAALAFLPPRAVAVDDSWNPETWAVQMLVGLETILKTDIQCTLKSVTGDRARVTIRGTVEGATAELTISGEYTFDIAQKHIRSLEIVQTETRSIGPISPGMNVTARCSWTRTLHVNDGPLTDRRIARVPLEPTNAMLDLALDLPDGARLQQPRGWHLFHQTGRTAVLRMIADGSLLAQCNINILAAAAPGEHLPAQQFEADVRKALGKQLTEVTSAGEFKSKNAPAEPGRFVYRVEATGKAQDIDMVWVYYLVADRSGKQVALMFACEEKLRKKMGDTEERIVNGLRFKATGLTPAAGSNDNPPRKSSRTEFGPN